VSTPIPAPLWRRLAAALYDGLLLAALIVVVTAAWVTLRGAAAPAAGVPLRALWLLAALGFCGWFWTHGGATPGMRAWKLQLRRSDGAPLRWATACARFGYAVLSWAPLGAGVLWCAVDRRRQSWHDRLAGTEMVLLPR
jgi:uncharacterized RDD family membrane protein YckC